MEVEVEEPSPSSSSLSSPAGSSESIDLNFLPFLKREPKSEPASPERGPLPLPVPPTQTPQHQHVAAAAAAATSAPPPTTMPDLSAAPVMTPLQALPPNPDEDAVLREYYRLANLYFSSAGAGAIVPAPAPGSAAPAVVQSGSGSVVRKRRPRSSELVRVSSLGVRDQIYFRDLVRRARITFECLRVLLLTDDERAESLGLPGVAGFGGGGRDRRRVRADLRAAALMADHDLWLNRDRRIVGPMPGISVGDAFFYRMELCVLGLHGQVQAGIDYVTAGQSASGEPIATSIIVSGGYEDDDDRGDVLVYTGHGGRRNGGEFAYDKTGSLLRGKPLIYECGPYCRCPPSCPNRVSQKGLQHRLEVFRSRETGWGVRSLDLIKAGTFICEFSGIVLTHQQSEIVAANGDCLVRPNRFPPRWLDWGDISDVKPEYVAPDYPSLPELNFAIDVSRARNVACYFSHSCSPNVFVQFVLFDHYNASYPHLMIFAMENIPPLRELSIDYGMIDEWVGKLTM
nr:unnamed protein product [Digitaria exilis]